MPGDAMNPNPFLFPIPPDAELVRLAQQGEKRAFVEIVARHQAAVCGVALGVLGDFTASEDAAQEAFVTAWKKMGDLREPEKLRAWLVQIARNTALAHVRRRGGATLEEVTDDLADENQQAPDEIAAGVEEAALVRGALAKLPASYRLPLVLYYRQDQSVREVAETLSLSEDAVKQRLARGREMLRERMAGLIETSLRCTQPGAIFTMTIAAAIGALAAPAAIAVSTFAASAATVSAKSTASLGSAISGSTASTTTSLATAMTASKVSLATAALIAAACLPIGYAVHFGTQHQPPREKVVAAAHKTTAAATQPDFNDSALFAEWRRLHEEHGNDAAAMPVLFNAIADVKDTFRRRAFRAALVAEWGQVDPAGGLDFLIKKENNKDACRQLFREWLDHDPRAAMAKLATCGEEGHKLAVDLLLDIARKAPEHVATIAARMPANEDRWKHPVTDAFAILAEKNLASARAAAEALAGPQREEALVGVAKAWAARDFDGALAWAKGLPEGVDRDGIIRSALMGLASTDILGALEKASLVPPGGRANHFADTTGARLLLQVGEKNFDTVTEWLRDHPGKIPADDSVGLAEEVGRRLNADPAKFLDEQLAKGTLATLGSALNSALLNNSKPQLAKVWEWLKAHPDREDLQALRNSVINSAGWQNPDLALAIAKELPETEAGAREIQNIARSVLNGGLLLDRLDSLLPETSGLMRAQLLDSAFAFMNSGNLDDPQKWLARLPELAAASRPAAAAALAGAWAGRDPHEAAQWASQLPADGGRSEALKRVAGAWLTRDSLAASEWIGQLPGGPDRDAGANMLVEQIAGISPDEAWQWAVTIGDGPMRMDSMKKALGTMAKSDPAEALHWINTSALPEHEKRSLREDLNAGAGGSEAR